MHTDGQPITVLDGRRITFCDACTGSAKRPLVIQSVIAVRWAEMLPVTSPTVKQAAAVAQIITSSLPVVTQETSAQSANRYLIKSPAVKCAYAAFCLNQQSVGVSVSMVQLEKESGFQSTDWDKSRGVLRHVSHMTRATESTRPTIWEKEDALPAVQTLTLKAVPTVLVTYESVAVLSASLYQVQTPATRYLSAVVHLNYLSVAKAGQEAVFSITGHGSGDALMFREEKESVAREGIELRVAKTAVAFKRETCDSCSPIIARRSRPLTAILRSTQVALNHSVLSFVPVFFSSAEKTHVDAFAATMSASHTAFHKAAEGKFVCSLEKCEFFESKSQQTRSATAAIQPIALWISHFSKATPFERNVRLQSASCSTSITLTPVHMIATSCERESSFSTDRPQPKQMSPKPVQHTMRVLESNYVIVMDKEMRMSGHSGKQKAAISTRFISSLQRPSLSLVVALESARHTFANIGLACVTTGIASTIVRVLVSSERMVFRTGHLQNKSEAVRNKSAIWLRGVTQLTRICVTSDRMMALVFPGETQEQDRRRVRSTTPQTRVQSVTAHWIPALVAHGLTIVQPRQASASTSKVTPFSTAHALVPDFRISGETTPLLKKTTTTERTEQTTGVTASVTVIHETRSRSSSEELEIQNLVITEEVVLTSKKQAQDLDETMQLQAVERLPDDRTTSAPAPSDISEARLSEETQVTEEVTVDGGVMFRSRQTKPSKTLQTEQEIICLETDLWMCEAFKSSSKPSAVVAQCSTTLFPLKSSLLCQNISCEQEKPFERTAYLLLSAISTSKMCTIRKTPVVSTKQELASCSQWDEKQYETRAAAASIHIVTRRPVVAQHTVALELEDKMRIQSLTTRRAAVSVLIITRRPLRTEEAVAIESADVYQSKSVSLRNAEAVIRLSQHSVGASVSMVQLEKESGFQSAYRNECRGALRHVFQMTRATESTCPTIWEKEDALPAIQTVTVNKAVASALITHETVAVLFGSLYQILLPAIRCASAAFYVHKQSVGVGVAMVQSTHWNEGRGALRNVFHMTRATESTCSTIWEKEDALMFRKETESVARKAIESRVARTAVAFRREACDSCSPFIASLLHPQTANSRSALTTRNHYVTSFVPFFASSAEKKHVHVFTAASSCGHLIAKSVEVAAICSLETCFGFDSHPPQTRSACCAVHQIALSTSPNVTIFALDSVHEAERKLVTQKAVVTSARRAICCVTETSSYTRAIPFERQLVQKTASCSPSFRSMPVIQIGSIASCERESSFATVSPQLKSLSLTSALDVRRVVETVSQIVLSEEAEYSAETRLRNARFTISSLFLRHASLQQKFVLNAARLFFADIGAVDAKSRQVHHLKRALVVSRTPELVSCSHAKETKHQTGEAVASVLILTRRPLLTHLSVAVHSAVPLPMPAPTVSYAVASDVLKSMSVGTMTSAPLLEKESQFAGLHHDVSRASERPVTSVSRGVGVSRPHVWDREHQYMQTNETAAATQSITKPMAKAAEIVRRETWESCNPFLASPVQLRTANTSSLKNTVNQTVCSILPVMNSCSKKSSVNLFSASEWHDHLPVKAAEQKEIQRLESCTSYETKTQQRRSASAVSCLTQQSLGATVSIVQLEKESGFQSSHWNECRGVLRHDSHMTRAVESTCPTILEKEDAFPEIRTTTLKAAATVFMIHETVTVLPASLYQVQSPAFSSSEVCYSNFKLTGVSQYCSALQCEDVLHAPAIRKAISCSPLHNGRLAVTYHKPALQTVSTHQIPTPTTRNASAAFCLNRQSAGVSVSMVQLDKESGLKSADWNECRGVLRVVSHMTRATEITRPTIWEKEDALPAVQTLILNRAVVSVLETHEAVAVLSMNLYQVQSPAATRCASAVSHLNYLSVAKAGQETVFSVAGPSEKSHIQQSAKHQVR